MLNTKYIINFLLYFVLLNFFVFSYGSPETTFNKNNCTPYVVKKGDTLSDLAYSLGYRGYLNNTKDNIWNFVYNVKKNTKEIKNINLIYPGELLHLCSHRFKNNISLNTIYNDNNTQNISDKNTEIASLVQEISQNRNTDVLKSQITSYLQDQTINKTQEFLKKDIDSIKNIEISPEIFSKGSNGVSARALVSLDQNRMLNNLWFFEPGYVDFNNRPTLNLGLGYRGLFKNNSILFGLNFFVDRDLKGHNTRISQGFEFDIHDLFFTGNVYEGLTHWHYSPDFNTTGLLEKPASGYDLKVKGDLPFYRPLSLSLKYFKWNGVGVDVNNDKTYVNSPDGLNFQVTYNPFPLLSLNFDQIVSKGSKPVYGAGLKFSYRLNESFSKQIKFNSSDSPNSLVDSMYNMVSRQYGIILNHKLDKLFLNLILEKAIINTGDIDEVSSNVSGGVPPYKYKWSVSKYNPNYNTNKSLNYQNTNQVINNSSKTNVLKFSQPKPGNYIVKLTVTDNANQSKSAQVNIKVVTNFSTTNSNYTVIGGNNLEVGTGIGSIVVTLEDKDKNKIKNADITKFTQTLGGSAAKDGNWVNNNDGTYTLKFTDTAAETVTPSDIKYDGQNITGSGSESVTFIPGGVSVANSTYTVTGGDKLAVGTGIGSIVVTLEDKDKNKIKNAEITKFTQTLGGSAAKDGNWVNNNDGTYTLKFTDTAAETVTPSDIKYDGQNITGSGSESVTFIPGGVSVANSTYTVTGGDKLAVGTGIGSIVVTLEDKDKNKIKNAEITKFTQTLGGSAAKDGNWVNNNDGTYTLKFTDTVVETVTPSDIKYDGQNITGSGSESVTFIPGGVSVANSTYTVTGGDKLVVGTGIGSIVVTLEDKHKNKIKNAEITKFTQTLGGSAAKDGNWVNNNDGTYTLKFTDTAAETVTASDIKYDGQNITGSGSESVTFIPGGVSVANSTYTVTGGDKLVVGTGIGSIVVTLEDEYKNKINNAEITKFTQTLGGSAAKDGNWVNNNDGTYTLKFTDTVAETVTESDIKYDGQNITGSGSESVTFIPGGVSVANSTYTVTGGDKLAVGTGIGSIVVTLEDEYKNKINNAEITKFTQTLGGSAAKDGNWVNNNDGTYTLKFTDTVVETVTPSDIKYDGQNITGSGSVTFIPGGVFVANSTYTVTGGDKLAVGTGIGSIVVTLEDKHKNKIKNAEITKFTQTLGGSAAKDGNWVNNNDGTYTLKFTDTAAETVTASDIKYDGQNITGLGSESVTFIPGGVSVANSTYTVTGGDKLVVGTGIGSIVVTLEDEYKNKINNAEITKFTQTLGGSAAKDGNWVNNNDGTYTLKFTDTAAETVTASDIKYDGQNITGSGSESVTFIPGGVSVANSTYTVTGGDKLVVGTGIGSIVVTLEDEYKNKINNAEITKFTQTLGGSAAKDGNWVNNNDGTYTLKFTDTVAETVTESDIKYDGQNITGSGSESVTFIPGGVSVANSTYTVTGGDKLAVGTGIGSIVVTLEDEYKNKINNAEITKFTQTLGGSAAKDGNWVNNNDGTYTLKFTDTVVETVTPSDIKYDGQNITGSGSESVTFIPGGVSVANSTYTVTGGDKLVVGTGIGSIVVTLEDKHKNKIKNAEITKFTQTLGGSAAKDGNWVNNNDGTYTLKFTDTAAETVTASDIKYDGQNITGSGSESVTFIPGGVSVANSTYTVTGGDKLVRITGIGSIVVTLEDEYKNKIKNAEITKFTQTLGGSAAKDGNWVNNNDGTYTLKFTDTVAETVTPSDIKYDGQNITGSGSVTFIYVIDTTKSKYGIYENYGNFAQGEKNVILVSLYSNITHSIAPYSSDLASRITLHNPIGTYTVTENELSNKDTYPFKITITGPNQEVKEHPTELYYRDRNIATSINGNTLTFYRPWGADYCRIPSAGYPTKSHKIDCTKRKGSYPGDTKNAGWLFKYPEWPYTMEKSELSIYAVMYAQLNVPGGNGGIPSDQFTIDSSLNYSDFFESGTINLIPKMFNDNTGVSINTDSFAQQPTKDDIHSARYGNVKLLTYSSSDNPIKNINTSIRYSPREQVSNESTLRFPEQFNITTVEPAAKYAGGYIYVGGASYRMIYENTPIDILDKRVFVSRWSTGINITNIYLVRSLVRPARKVWPTYIG